VGRLRGGEDDPIGTQWRPRSRRGEPSRCRRSRDAPRGVSAMGPDGIATSRHPLGRPRQLRRRHLDLAEAEDGALAGVEDLGGASRGANGARSPARVRVPTRPPSFMAGFWNLEPVFPLKPAQGDAARMTRTGWRLPHLASSSASRIHLGEHSAQGCRGETGVDRPCGTSEVASVYLVGDPGRREDDLALRDRIPLGRPACEQVAEHSAQKLSLPKTSPLRRFYSFFHKRSPLTTSI
jgi:hypothetical protein